MGNDSNKSKKGSESKVKRLNLALSVFVVFSVFSAFFASSAWGAFERQDTGARPSALGGAFVAVGGDVHSLLYNPAGLSYLSCKELSSSYGKLFTGLDDGSNLSHSLILYGQPVKTWGSIGIGWMETKLDSLYQERTLALGYGRSWMDNLSFGAALKQYQISVSVPGVNYDDNGNTVSGADAVFARGRSAGAMGLDLGMFYEPVARYGLGLSVQNVNQPRLSLSGSDDNRLNALVRLGASYRGSGLLGVCEFRSQEYLQGRRDYQAVFGAEKWWYTGRISSFVLRGSLAYGSRSYSQAAIGLGYRVNGLEMDYAFLIPLSGVTFGDTSGTHRLSISLRFGRRATDRTVWMLEEAPYDYEEMEALRQELERTKRYAAQAELTVQLMHDRILNLESELKKQKEMPVSVTTAAVAGSSETIRALEEQILQLRQEMEKARQETQRVQQRKDAIEQSLKKQKIPTVPVSGNTYVVQSGDTLRSIAQKVWGDPSRWIEIYKANEDRILRGGDVTQGQILVIP